MNADGTVSVIVLGLASAAPGAKLTFHVEVALAIVLPGWKLTAVIVVAALATDAIPSSPSDAASTETANLFPRFIGLNRDGPPRPTAE